MGDILVDILREEFELKSDEDGIQTCPKCGGMKFVVKLESPVYVVTLAPEDSYPDADFGQSGPEIETAECIRCGFELKRYGPSTTPT